LNEYNCKKIRFCPHREAKVQLRNRLSFAELKRTWNWHNAYHIL